MEIQFILWGGGKQTNKKLLYPVSPPEFVSIYI